MSDFYVRIWVGAVTVLEQKKLEGLESLEMPHRIHLSGAHFVGRLLAIRDSRGLERFVTGVKRWRFYCSQTAGR